VLHPGLLERMRQRNAPIFRERVVLKWRDVCGSSPHGPTISFNGLAARSRKSPTDNPARISLTVADDTDTFVSVGMGTDARERCEEVFWNGN
jgi:hypothetical protein